jgi:hypothetical protein
VPFPNEHAARQLPPGNFIKFRRSNLKFPKGISAIIGIKSNGKTAIQSLRFDRKIWTVPKAREWLKSHNFKTTIEEATKKNIDWSNII